MNSLADKTGSLRACCFPSIYVPGLLFCAYFRDILSQFRLAPPVPAGLVSQYESLSNASCPLNGARDQHVPPAFNILVGRLIHLACGPASPPMVLFLPIQGRRDWCWWVLF